MLCYSEIKTNEKPDQVNRKISSHFQLAKHFSQM